MLRTCLHTAFAVLALISFVSDGFAQKREPTHRASVAKVDSVDANWLFIQELERMMPENRLMPNDDEKHFASTPTPVIEKKKKKRSSSRAAAARPANLEPAPALHPRELEHIAPPKETASSGSSQ